MGSGRRSQCLCDNLCSIARPSSFPQIEGELSVADRCDEFRNRRFWRAREALEGEQGYQTAAKSEELSRQHPKARHAILQRASATGGNVVVLVRGGRAKGRNSWTTNAKFGAAAERLSWCAWGLDQAREGGVGGLLGLAFRACLALPGTRN